MADEPGTRSRAGATSGSQKKPPAKVATAAAKTTPSAKKAASSKKDEADFTPASAPAPGRGLAAVVAAVPAAVALAPVAREIVQSIKSATRAATSADAPSTSKKTAANLALNILSSVTKELAPHVGNGLLRAAALATGESGTAPPKRRIVAGELRSAMKASGPATNAADDSAGEEEKKTEKKAKSDDEQPDYESWFGDTPTLEAFPAFEDAISSGEPTTDGAMTEGPGEEDDGTSCPICLNPLRKAMTGPCGHAMCSKCLDHVVSMTPKVGCCRAHAKPGTPLCPVCRKPVHKSVYRPCPALDKAVAKLHPNSQHDDASEGKKEPELDEHSVEGLRVWKLAQEEQCIQAAVKLVWDTIKDRISDSTAVLLMETSIPTPAAVGEVAQAYPQQVRRTRVGTRGGRRGPMQNPFYPLIGVPGADLDEEAAYMSQDSISEMEQEKIWSTMWTCRDEIAKRLRASGLEVTFFRHLGVEHSLITWPQV